MPLKRFRNLDEIVTGIVHAIQDQESEEVIAIKLRHAMGGTVTEPDLDKVIDDFEKYRRGYILYQVALNNIASLRVEGDDIHFAVKDTPEARMVTAQVRRAKREGRI